ncbi:MAG TPA: hypothetical protein VF078_08225 [Nitrospira sp.]
MERLAAGFGTGPAVIAVFLVWGVAQTLVMLRPEFLLNVPELLLQGVTCLRRGWEERRTEGDIAIGRPGRNIKVGGPAHNSI